MYGQLMAGSKQFVHCREVVLLSECPLSEVLLYMYIHVCCVFQCVSCLVLDMGHVTNGLSDAVATSFGWRIHSLPTVAVTKATVVRDDRYHDNDTLFTSLFVCLQSGVFSMWF